MGIIVATFIDTPDLLVDEHAKLYAVRSAADGYAFSSKNPGFVRDTWLRRLAVSDPHPWQAELTSAHTRAAAASSRK